MKILISGASGLLGRAIVDRFKNDENGRGHQVISLSFTRSGPGLEKIDLRDEQSVSNLIHDLKPDVFIHCAAERRPDVAERDPTGTEKLNVRVTEHLAELSNQFGFKMIYICTDYVFDGNAPMGGYDVDATPNPTNFYGKTKLAGEQAMLNTVVNLLEVFRYGKAETNNESDYVLTANVNCVEFQDPLPPILHCSSEKEYTKYKISLEFAKLLKLSEAETKNLIPQPEPPKLAQGETMRPRDCRLSNRALSSLGISVQHADFIDWWSAYLHTNQSG
ncbi:uncharacterized protein VP01_1352g1 [Puccinia sorghi]|uniref:RmlD-like substrate binding domain-containing protein n=1 Tax=Puccinia sorghi TaxID=27349 RepID=A0A0L6VM84_9BASI|nr:uncharacterized protein VP01_1352g1 [Puccinia sorghi]